MRIPRSLGTAKTTCMGNRDQVGTTAGKLGDNLALLEAGIGVLARSWERNG